MLVASTLSLCVTSQAMHLHILTLLLLLLIAPTSPIGVPTCVRPPPPPSSLPTVADCNRLLQHIAVVARLQHNMPLTWSRHPPGTAGQQLPAYFSYGSDNECEFVVDVSGGREEEDVEDVFPTGDVVFIGRYVMQTCLAGGAGTEDTVGSCAVGPREVLRITLRKKEVDEAAGGSLGLVNGTLLGLSGMHRETLLRALAKAEEESGNSLISM